MLNVQIGDLGLAYDEQGNERRARVVKVRGGNRFDLAIEGISPHDSQHVGLVRGPGELFHFVPDGAQALPASEPEPVLRLWPKPPKPAPWWPLAVSVALSTGAAALELLHVFHFIGR